MFWNNDFYRVNPEELRKWLVPPSVVSMLLCRLSRRYFLSGQGEKMLHSRSYGTVF
jgi:hypothetical protein